jgi:hypothetical protein
MALAIYFPVEGMSAEKYDQVLRRLEEAGQGSPAGRTYHCSFKAGEGLHVFDVWDSQESFDAFGRTLMPIVAETGVVMPEPQIAEVYKIIEG